MMELNDITRELYDASARLRKGSGELFKLAKARAESERAYRMALAAQIVELRAEGIQASLIPDIARGVCAELKYQRDLDDGRYMVGRDSLDAIKTQISALQTIVRYQEEL